METNAHQRYSQIRTTTAKAYQVHTSHDYISYYKSRSCSLNILPLMMLYERNNIMFFISSRNSLTLSTYWIMCHSPHPSQNQALRSWLTQDHPTTPKHTFTSPFGKIMKLSSHRGPDSVHNYFEVPDQNFSLGSQFDSCSFHFVCPVVDVWQLQGH